MAQNGTEISNYKNAEGKYAFTVIEFTLKDNVILAHYPKIIDSEDVEDEEGNTFTKTTMCVGYGIITSGYQPIEPQFIGDLDELFAQATEIKGQTFVVKDILKRFGFRRWNKDTKSWAK